jgi:hypothetical protein
MFQESGPDRGTNFKGKNSTPNQSELSLFENRDSKLWISDGFRIFRPKKRLTAF